MEHPATNYPERARRFAVFGLVLCSLMVGTPSSAADRHNVLFIAVDDLRSELGCYGVSTIHSPNIDALAASGVRFDRAYCQLAVCNPSRVSVMTGLRPDSTKVWDLATRFRQTIPNAVTLPQHLRKHGYDAVSFGKIFHNPWPDNDSWSQPHQWPEKSRLWSDQAKQRLAAFRQTMRKSGKSEAAIKRMRPQATEVVDITDSEHIDGAIADQAIGAMRRLAEQDKPFFLAAGFVRPHLPFVVPRKYWDLYDRETLPLADNQFISKDAPRYALNTMYELRDYWDFAEAADPRDRTLTEAQQRELKHGYYASVSMIDAQVGRLLGELDQLGLTDKTIVVLWSDHGWKLGEHNSWCKQTNYEIDTRVPLIIRNPDSIANGKSSHSLVELVDLYPTLCELTGTKAPNDVEGNSLAKLLDDPNASVKSAAFSQFRRRVGNDELMGYAMRTDRYRYVQWMNRMTNEIVGHELYDHKQDPGENQNLAGRPAQKTRLAELSKQLWQTLPPPPAFTPTRRPKPRPSIQFQNNRDETLTVYWLPDHEPRKKAGEIKPGKTLLQNSTNGHRFLILGSESSFRKTVTVTKNNETVILAGDHQTQSRKRSDRPNIVVIMGDDWSWPHASALGDPVVKTPTFDRLAAEGVLFEHAFVSAPSCTPSRFSFVTGQHHWRLGEGDSLGGSLAAAVPVPVPVYPDLLAAAGYEIGFARKGAAPSKHLYRGNDPFGPKFKDFDDFMSQRDATQPFCFWNGAGEPHRPYDWRASLESDLELDQITVPACLPDNDTTRTDLGDYYLRVQKLDQLAGRIVKQLETENQLENTIVVMTSDNGMPFPRCKATLYDMGTRVPLVVRWGKHLKGGHVVKEFVSLTDLAPTFLAAARLPIPVEMTGRSLMNLLSGKREPVDRDHVLIGRERHVQAWPARGIRTKDFLYIRNYSPETWSTGAEQGSLPEYNFSSTPWPTQPPAFSFNCDPSPTKQWMQQNLDASALLYQLAFELPPAEELYDLRNDPAQLVNVAKDRDYRQLAEQLSDRLNERLTESNDPRSIANELGPLQTGK